MLEMMSSLVVKAVKCLSHALVDISLSRALLWIESLIACFKLYSIYPAGHLLSKWAGPPHSSCT